MSKNKLIKREYLKLSYFAATSSYTSNAIAPYAEAGPPPISTLILIKETSSSLVTPASKALGTCAISLSHINFLDNISI